MPCASSDSNSIVPNQQPEVYEVECILQRGHTQDGKYYLVKWKGYSDGEATWEPQSNLANCPQAIEKFEAIIKKIEQDKLQSKNQQSKKNAHSKVDDRHYLKKNSSKQMQINKNASKKLNAAKDSEKIKEKNKKPLQVNKFQTKIQSQPKADKKFCSESYHQQDQLETTSVQTAPSNILDKEHHSNGSEKKEKFQNAESTKRNELVEPIKFQNNTTEKKLNTEPLKISQAQMAFSKEVTEQQNFQKLKLNFDQEKLAKKKEVNVQNFEIDEILSKPKKKRKVQDFPEKNRQKDKADAFSRRLSQKTSQSKVLDLKNQKNKSNFKFQTQIKLQINPQKLQQKPVFEEKNLNQFVSGPQKRNYFSENSHRLILCEQQFRDLKAEKILLLTGALKNKNSSTRLQINNYLGRFIDISTPECSIINQKFLLQIIDKQKVIQLDENGEFLYSKIEELIKVQEQNNQIQRSVWVCMITKPFYEDKIPSQREQNYFIKVEDLREDTWKKMFRKFTLSFSH